MIAMRGPHSYTAEHSEIDLPRQCPGNEKILLETVIKYGARPGRPENLKTGILNGRIDLLTGRSCDGCDSFKK